MNQLPNDRPEGLNEVFLRCEKENVRLDSFLAGSTSLSRSRAAEIIKENLVTVNGKNEKKNFLLSRGDEILALLPEDKELEAKPENIPLDIVYEDHDLVVINKPQGMVVHPAPGNPDHTLVNALLFHCRNSLSGINGKLRPGIVHRIDKYTSGLLVAAKNDTAHTGLSELFQKHDFVRKYHAIVYGNVKDDSGTVRLAIGRHRSDRKKMAAFPPDSPNTKNAVTHYRVLERFPGYTYVELTLETGRTHQIRVHMLSLGHPVLDDKLYAPGRKSFGLDGQCLHAKVLEFCHPITKQEMKFESPLPNYFEAILEKLRKGL